MKITKTMSWLKVILVLSLICSFALTATAQDYYPTTIGNTWDFLSTDGAERRTYSIEESDTETDAEAGIFILRILTETLGTDTVDNDVYYISDDAGDLKLHRIRTEERGFGIAAATLDPPALFFPADLPVGRPWDIVTVAELDLIGTATTTSTIEVVDSETLETPAGTFENCVKLEIRRKSDTALVTIRTTSYQWLAPDVGPVKYEDDQGIVYELQSYTLVEPPAVETPAEPETPEEPPAVETPEEPAVETPEEPMVETPVVTPEEPAVETPEEPMVETPTEPETPEEPMVETPALPKSSFDIALESGLNMISIPLMPAEPYTAKSLAAKLGSSIVIKLDAATQQFVGYSYAEEGEGFDIDGSSGYIVNTPAGGVFTFAGTAWQNKSDAIAAAPNMSTAKNAWAFVITSNLQDKENGSTYTIVAKNLRTGVIATENVANDKESVSAVWANINRKSVIQVGDKLEVTLLDKRGTVVSGPFQRTVTTSDIHNAYLSVQMRVGDVRPKATILGQNFPNPFNPETWIPYQLSRDSNVTIKIYNVSGSAIRTLNLGHKSIGSYMTTSTAAYWDGKNGAGERVSSGIYFYTLQTKNFSATRRMVILK